MTKRVAAAWQNFLRVSLWLASAGLMLASSGLDGAYLAKLMPLGFGWLGLVLNTVSDVTSELIMYWYGRLQMGSKTKRRLARWLLAPQVLLVGYAWLFGWRQLLPIMRELESADYSWLSMVAAGFVPVGILAVGFTQAILAGKIEKEQEPSEVRSKPEPLASFVCEICGAKFPSQNALNGHMRAHSDRSNGRQPARQPELATVSDD